VLGSRLACSQHPLCLRAANTPNLLACVLCVSSCHLLLQGIVPREAAVHIMMGRLHKRLRNPDAALTAFNTGTLQRHLQHRLHTQYSPLMSPCCPSCIKTSSPALHWTRL
jgi:hypothetical protein